MSALRTQSFLVPPAAVALLFGWGCSDRSLVGNEPLAAELGGLPQPIIGGLPAPSPLLNHTGALKYRSRATGRSEGLCSASLIAPQTVVTAYHCVYVLPMFERFGLDVFWAAGPDFNSPIEEIPVVAVERAPADDLVSPRMYDRDVGVAHLDEPSEMPTIDIQQFDPDLLGISMVTLGYGVSSGAGLIDGLRRVGRETVSQVEGPAYAGLFGDFESFVELTVTGEITDLDILPLVEADPSLVDLAALRAEYDASTLIPDHQVVTGKAPGDTQTCELDSGGPLARITPAGRWESYGVVSEGFRPEDGRPFCEFGQVFAVFGPVTFPFLEAARAWEDPCGDIGVAGQCAGDRLQRCDSRFANGGVRQLVAEDCAASGATCVTSSTGAACSSLAGEQ